MEKKIDWSKAPEGATHFCLSSTDGSNWRDYSGRIGMYWYEGKWVAGPFTSKGFLEHCTSHEARPAQAWNGEGLPPVEVVCERMWSSGLIEYAKVRIIAHDEGQAVFRFLEGLRAGQVQSDEQGHGDSLGNPIFRPIKTAEQIAAEEREAAITAAYQFVSDWPNEVAVKSIIGKLYDAGCIKQPATTA